jgi:hypothetical protein
MRENFGGFSPERPPLVVGKGRDPAGLGEGQSGGESAPQNSFDWSIGFVPFYWFVFSVGHKV